MRERGGGMFYLDGLHISGILSVDYVGILDNLDNIAYDNRKDSAGEKDTLEGGN
jgi:hypothetical protein